METELSEVTGLPSGWRERLTIILHLASGLGFRVYGLGFKDLGELQRVLVTLFKGAVGGSVRRTIWGTIKATLL